MGLPREKCKPLGPGPRPRYWTSPGCASPSPPARLAPLLALILNSGTAEAEVDDPVVRRERVAAG